jgi:hypothetical protein
VQSVLIAEVGDELGHRHVPPGPRNHRVGLAIEDVGDEPAHPVLVGLQALQQVGVPEGQQ